MVEKIKIFNIETYVKDTDFQALPFQIEIFELSISKYTDPIVGIPVVHIGMFNFVADKFPI